MPIYTFLESGEIQEEPRVNTVLIQKARHVTLENLAWFVRRAREAQGVLHIEVLGDSESTVRLLDPLLDLKIDSVSFDGAILIESVAAVASRMQRVIEFEFHMHHLSLREIAGCRCEDLAIHCVDMAMGPLWVSPLFSTPKMIDINIVDCNEDICDFIAAGVSANTVLEKFKFTGTVGIGSLINALRERPALRSLEFMDFFWNLNGMGVLKSNPTELAITMRPRTNLRVVWDDSVIVPMENISGEPMLWIHIEDFIRANMPSRALHIRAVIMIDQDLERMPLPPIISIGQVYPGSGTKGGSIVSGFRVRGTEPFSVASGFLMKGTESFNVEFLDDDFQIDASIVLTRSVYETNAKFNESVLFLLEQSTTLRTLTLRGPNVFTQESARRLAFAITNSPSLRGFNIRIPRALDAYLMNQLTRAVMTNTRLVASECSVTRNNGVTVVLSRMGGGRHMRNAIMIDTQGNRILTMHTSLLPGARNTFLRGMLQRSGDNRIMYMILLFLLDVDEEGEQLRLMD